MGLEFRILGPLEVVHDGRALPLGGSRERAVLALLVLSPNRVVSAERLADELWAGEPPAGALHTLQVFVSRVRKALRQSGVDGIVVTQPPGYLVRVDAGDIDAHRFEALVGTARAEASRGAHDQAAALLREAVGLWRGPALADVADAPSARAEAARLEEIRLAATEERVAAELACGRHGELIPELDALTRSHPLRERLWALRMTALYRSGRQAEALRAYQELRSMLADELGLEPSAALSRLETAILRQDPELEWSPAATASQPAPAPAMPVPTPVVSRTADRVADVASGGPVTVMFTDVEASTELRSRRGDRVAHHLLRDHEELVRTRVEAHGGREIKALGDGFTVVFTSPRDALACAVDIQRALAGRRSELADIRIRIGLNTGELETEGDDVYGLAVHAAARIAAKAAGGEILVAEVVKHLAGADAGFSFRDRGQFRLKGFPERVRLYEVGWRDEDDAAPAVFARRTPYVGRGPERAELITLLDAALKGRGALVMVGGEPGVGKTRLTEEVAAEARNRGMRVRVGRCYEMGGTSPYIPFVEILEQALAQAASPAAFRELAGEDAPEVAKLLPRLRQLFPDIPPPLELPAEQERRYLFNSLADTFARAASARPIFLVLDDLHWADEPTLLLFEHLAGRIPDISVLAVATYRDTEVTPEHPLAQSFDSLVRRQLVRRMSLRRFPEDGTAGLLRALSGREPPASLVRTIHAETDGNPFFVEEVYKHLAEEGRLLDGDGRFRPEVAVGVLDVPDSLRIILGRRLDRLGDDGRRALAAAAVVGRAFTYELLEALGELEPDALLDALDEAERARLVAPLSDAADEDRLLFSHELIRQTLLAGLSQPRRRRLHLRVAEILEELHGDALEDQASEIAHHLTQAGAAADRAKLLRYRILAGRRAMATAGFEDALRHFEAALSMRQVAEPNQLADLLFDLAAARRSVGRTEAALATWDEAAGAYEAVGDAEGVARACTELAWDLLWANGDAEAVQQVERGLQALGAEPTAQRARMLAAGVACGAWIAPYESGAAMADEALAIAEQLGDDGLLGMTLSAKGGHCFAFYQSADAADACLRAGPLLRAAGNLWDLAMALGFGAIALTELGRLDEATERVAEMTPLAQKIGHFGAIWMLVAARGAIHSARASDLEAYSEWAREFRDLGVPMSFQCFAYPVLGYIEFLRGDWDAARRLIEDGCRHELPNRSNGFEWGHLFQLLAYRGERAEALDVLERKRAGLPVAGQPNSWGGWQLLLFAVEGLWILGERDQAAALYPLVLELLANGTVLTEFHGRLTERVAGIAAAAGRQWNAAEAHFLTAVGQAEALPHPLEGAETRRFYAQMLLDRAAPDGAERAADLLGGAVDVYRRIGMPRHLEMTEALLAEAR